MQRVTISIDDQLVETLDQLIAERGYQSRSEAMRDLVRGAIESWRQENSRSEHCVANLSYVFDRRTRSLPQRLADLQHEHHDLVAASTLVRLDHDHGLESVMLKGPTRQVKAFADRVRAERGVRFGTINMLDVEAGDGHDHAGAHDHHGHAHMSPRSK
ncbi:nickel-responsive transcriptional regulator NikR [Novosphingobium aerophilum]|uniref:nickel-responsive transcriptional regulator NikR n=1 Tax=Novosphingobium TaxID=165696 RepID=UPI0006C838C8|nr:MULTISPECIES: nickel-responsive transcriptional regulator NikR [unclassified Novosphingobium]KPH66114.1 nickel responsive regulator [Novosphingobium sp. ST904]MPS70225.1 nickel-responsive transcriptional regulator NikR [Novosphingobium sp.]TCM35173.1 CopG family transcriptional regulator [Novosphingobium sp. ST904]WRT94804.1 nickel-responsive transcriptional regulator NikR [Novosphingobium sp. RL4]